MRQHEHCHDDVFGDRRLVPENIADRDSLRQRDIELIKSRRDRL
jgi:hypothetical protein